MSNLQTLHNGHKVLGEEYCEGYADAFGKWNTGFPCTFEDDTGLPVFCCGTEFTRYCCVRPKTPVPQPVSQLTLLLSLSFAALVAIAVIVMVSCFHCACCILYKKRQPLTRGDTVYQMRCPPPVSGVANMYSFSGTATPTDTPQSISIASSSRDASCTSTVDDFQLEGENPLYIHNSRPGSVTLSSDRNSSTPSDVTERGLPSAVLFRPRLSITTRLLGHQFEPPPPYSSGPPSSSVVPVRTTLTGLGSMGNESRNAGVIGSGVHNEEDSGLMQLSTFSHDLSTLPTRLAPIRNNNFNSSTIQNVSSLNRGGLPERATNLRNGNSDLNIPQSGASVFNIDAQIRTLRNTNSQNDILSGTNSNNVTMHRVNIQRYDIPDDPSVGSDIPEPMTLLDQLGSTSRFLINGQNNGQTLCGYNPRRALEDTRFQYTATKF